MQGINSLTGCCTYKTPCSWCTKWDKKCDKKIPDPPVINFKDPGMILTSLKASFYPCGECVHEDLDLPICDSCNVTNNFKHFEGWENTK